MAETLVPYPSRGVRLHEDADTGSRRLMALLLIHAVVWTVGASLYRANLDWSGDMLENYSWGIAWQAGYHKHPPLFAWMAAAWFGVFPHTDAAYFALSMTNALLGLCGIAALARRFLPPREAAVAALAMAVSPIYTTLAVKFNANTVLLSLWPWTAYFFVRYVQTGTRRAALALGAAAGLAMLGKYFSVALLGGLCIAGLARPAWRARLLRPETLLAVMAFAVVLWAHARWFVQTGMPTLGYASERMRDVARPLPIVALDLLRYAAIQVGYLLPSMAFLLVLARHSRARAAKLMLHGYVRRSLDPDLWWLAMATFMVVCVLALLTRTELSALWGHTQWFAIVAFWLAVLANAGIGLNMSRIPAVLGAYWVLTLALSVAGGYLEAVHHRKGAMEPRLELARAAHAVWRDHAGQPLAIVAGDDKEARSVAFYADRRIHYWDMFDPATTPWIREADVRRQGALFVCRDNDVHCRDAAAAFTGVAPVTVTVAKTRWGVTFPARSYVLFVMPAAPSAPAAHENPPGIPPD